MKNWLRMTGWSTSMPNNEDEGLAIDDFLDPILIYQ